MIKISLKFALKGLIDNNPALIQNRRQAIIGANATRFSDAYMRH